MAKVSHRRADLRSSRSVGGVAKRVDVYKPSRLGEILCKASSIAASDRRAFSTRQAIWHSAQRNLALNQHVEAHNGQKLLTSLLRWKLDYL